MEIGRQARDALLGGECGADRIAGRGGRSGRGGWQSGPAPQAGRGHGSLAAPQAERGHGDTVAPQAERGHGDLAAPQAGDGLGDLATPQAGRGHGARPACRIEWLRGERPATPVAAAIFDFDGTISTLRRGWEAVMAPMMAEMIEGGGGPDEAVRKMVREYVDESTGVQTIFQMKWLAEQARAYGRGGAETDGWDAWMYKAEYNRRLMAPVGERCARIASGGASPAGFMISGSREMLELLAGRGIELYVASGTDDADVKREAALLGLAGLFTDIKGAPEGSESCPKEAAIRALINERGFGGGRLAVVGDGKVEIAVGRENGARTLGVASDEEALAGVNPAKRARLLSAKADAIVGDFRDMEAIKEFFLGEARHGEG